MYKTLTLVYTVNRENWTLKEMDKWVCAKIWVLVQATPDTPVHSPLLRSCNISLKRVGVTSEWEQNIQKKFVDLNLLQT